MKRTGKARPNTHQAAASAEPEAKGLLATLAAQNRLVWIVFAGGCLAAVLLVWQVYRIDTQRTRTESHQALSSIDRLLDDEFAQEADTLVVSMAALCENDELAKALQQRDRQRLLDLSQPLFEETLKPLGITHFYFMDPDRVCVLRVHNPQKHGDVIDRETARQAALEDTRVEGTERGRFGTLTLRVIQPWHVDGERIGFLELGCDADMAVREMRDHLDIDAITFVPKDAVERKQWETGMQMLGHAADWDTHPTYVAVDADGGAEAISPMMIDLVTAAPGTVVQMKEGGRIWHGESRLFRDSFGRTIGRLVVRQDVTDRVAADRRDVLMIVIFATIILATLAVIYVFYRRRVDGQLKQTAEQLSAQARFLQDVIDAIPTPVYFTDVESCFRGCNDAFLAFCGCDRGHVIGQNIDSTDYGIVTAEKSVRTHRQLLAAGGTERYEATVMTGRGPRDILFNKAAFHGAEGEVQGIVGVMLDITDQKHINELVERQHDRFSSILSAIDTGIVLADSEGQIIEANASFCRLTGVPLENIREQPLATLRIGGSMEELLTELPRTHGHEGVTLERRVGTATCVLRLQRIRPEMGGGYLLTVTDVTDLVEARSALLNMVDDLASREKQLEKANRLQEQLLATAATAFFSVDQDRRIVSCNEEFCETLGIPAEKAIGQLCDIIHCETCKEHCGLFDPEGGMVRKKQCAIKRLDGKRRVILKNASLLRDDNGNVTGGLESFIDVTPLVEAREEAEQARQQAEASNDDLQKAIGRANEMALKAEAANRAKSEFLAKMSHEIRTPMNGVIGMTELALDTELTDEQREYLTLVRRSADSLLEVINDILDFSKIEAGKLSLERAEFSLRDTVNEAISPLAVRAHAKGLELVCHVLPDVPDTLIGDSLRFKQVVINLLGNAVKFTDCGEVLVRVEPLSWDTSHMRLLVKVKDTGIGIAEEKRNAIFEAFEQADGGTTRQYGGTGLGLPISAQLAQMMGGEMWVESEVGKGSEFCFTVVFGVAARQDDQQVTNHMTDGRRVLVLEPNASSATVLRETLANWAMQSVVTHDVGAAVEAVRQASQGGRPFDLAIISGPLTCDVLRQLRQAHSDGRLPVIGLTTATAGKKGEVAGEVDAIIFKPLHQSALLNSVQQIFGGDAVAAAPPDADAAEDAPGASGLRVLLAEDNAVNQRLATRLLKKMQHDVVVVDNGRKAVDACQSDPFDLILMDVQMPELDGLEATREIRRREAETGLHVPIVAMTAHAMKGDRTTCLDAGMDGYVSKPIRFGVLRTEINRVISGLARNAVEETGEDEASVLNEVEALVRLDGDRGMLVELLELFAEEQEPMLAAVWDALAQRDNTLLVRAAHTLKGALANVSAHAARQAAQRLEAAAEKDDMVAAGEAVARLQQEVARFLTAAQNYINREASCES